MAVSNKGCTDRSDGSDRRGQVSLLSVRLLAWALCLALATSGSFVLSACASSEDGDEDAMTDVAEKIEEATEPDDDDEGADEEPSGQEDSQGKSDDTTADQGDGGDEQGFGTWADECMDALDTPTAYAISELKGWQLETLFQEKGYTWSFEDSCWWNGKTSVTVRNGDYEPMDDATIAELDKGGVPGAPVVYVITTKNYTSCAEAYQALVSDVIVSDDVAFSEDDGVCFGVGYGPSMAEMLFEMIGDDYGVTLYVFPKDSVAAGMFDKAAEGSYGSTPDEVFETIVGYAPGSQH